MKISDSIKEYILDDLDFALKKMEEAKDKDELLYFFSAFAGAVHRAFNIEYKSDLVFAHLILKTTHETITARLKSILSGNEKNIPLYEHQFETLIQISKEFRDKISDNKSFDSVLKKMAILTYSATGNGYYLYSKGLIKI
ncbi:hypothetical protein DSCA_49120 [Desulfosarcina alkanivorans]|uniref:Uncharacterized protein n=1 Tax=Desulfosarcina alkanivorans TaxID=571177 RepID=A0A5K7YMK4_9BACT|nr:hypothetical protein [Desulfosarcina alkanivorans]BBO70982.1 hypothetical protein DSCA_49120 [Desulfosarcina alkanivorans]